MRAIGAAILLLLTLGASPLLAAGDARKKMELVCELGRRKSMKIYSGESLTFRVQEMREGIEGIFSAGKYLRGVTFTLQSYPEIRTDAMGIVPGVSRPVIRTKGPGRELWGCPPSSFQLVGARDPGRYLLTAKKPGYAPARVFIHVAHFHVINGKAEIGRVYSATFDLRLRDPAEKGKSIPLLVETLSPEGRVIDSRDDLVLAPVWLEADEYRTNRTIRISSAVAETFRSQLKRLARTRGRKPPPDFFDSKSLLVVEGGAIRFSFRQVRAVYRVPL